MNTEFSTRFAPCDKGCKLWFLVGGKLKTPGLEIAIIDETPTLAKRVRTRWKNMLLEKKHTDIGYGEILVQLLGEKKVREIWPQYYFPWQHNKIRRQNRREKALGIPAPVNHFHTPSVRTCARRSII